MEERVLERHGAGGVADEPELPAASGEGEGALHGRPAARRVEDEGGQVAAVALPEPVAQVRSGEQAVDTERLGGEGDPSGVEVAADDRRHPSGEALRDRETDR